MHTFIFIYAFISLLSRIYFLFKPYRTGHEAGSLSNGKPQFSSWAVQQYSVKTYEFLWEQIRFSGVSIFTADFEDINSYFKRNNILKWKVFKNFESSVWALLGFVGGKILLHSSLLKVSSYLDSFIHNKKEISWSQETKKNSALYQS